VANRYGSVVAAQLLRNPNVSQNIGPVLFIDPVSFLLHLPDVAYNFVSRPLLQTCQRKLLKPGDLDM
jgi:hypothetical protein